MEKIARVIKGVVSKFSKLNILVAEKRKKRTNKNE